jgi:hypothetical protein
MSLVRAELRRLVKRRFIRWMLVITLAVLALIATVIFASNQQPGPGALARAQAQAEQHYQENLRFMEQEIEACQQARDAGEDSDLRGWPEDCEEIRQWYGETSVEEMTQWFMPPTFDFRNSFGEMLTVFTVLLAMFGFLVGASFVGAEWRTGGMMNLLLWEPRRLRAFGAKLGTLLVSVLGLGIVLSPGWTAVMWWIARRRGITDTMTVGAWQSFGLTGLRGLVLVLAATALGFAIASIGRHTAMALGAAMVAAVVGLYGVLIAVTLSGVDHPQRWLWISYPIAWMQRRMVLGEEVSCGPDGECARRVVEITWQSAGLVIAAVVVLLVGAAMWHMRARDVT